MSSFIPPEYVPVLLKIYELTVLKKEHVTFSKLTEFFEKKDTCRSIDYLCDRCVIDEIWDKSSGQWVRTFEIVGQYIPFVEATWKTREEVSNGTEINNGGTL